MIRLVIADDHAIVRGGLKRIFALVPDVDVVAEAVNGSEVLERLRGVPCDLLLLDLNMPGIAGVDLIKRAKAHHPELPILVLSMHNEAIWATRALQAGATGYITKDCEPEILLAAIRKVATNRRYIDPEMAEKMVFNATASGPRPLHSRLSDRELEVCRLLVGGRGVNEIAEQLSISNKTVSSHKLRLMEKLGIGSVADLVRYAMEHDLLD